MADTHDNSLVAHGRRWKRTAAAFVKGTLRRRRDEFWPSREVREYEGWIARRLETRRSVYTYAPVPGLLSILTPVWDGSPVKYLRELAASIAAQNGDAASEWILLDNGCRRRELLACLQELAALSWVKLIRSEENAGITRGLRLCLTQASGRYVLPVDGDDRLDRDALQVVTSSIVEHNYPPLLYTDEDKIIGAHRRYQPYFKPDWDPVLLLNSAYIAHLEVIDRQLALKVGAYSDPAAEASPDWDLFVRFLSAGYAAVHVPEVVYSWRVHAQSTADDAASKPAVHASQKQVLQRYLDGRQDGNQFTVEYNPLFGGAPHFYLRSKRASAMRVVRFSSQNWREKLADAAQADEFVLLQDERVEITSPDWAREVSALFQFFPDAMMIGGRILGPNGRVIQAELNFSFDSPNAGISADDPGYFGQMWKQRSVSAVSSYLLAVRGSFLSRVLLTLPATASIALLGPWAGAQALREGKRVIYTPFLTGVLQSDEEIVPSLEERELFLRTNADVMSALAEPKRL